MQQKRLARAVHRAGEIFALASTALAGMASWSWIAGVGDVFRLGTRPPLAPSTAFLLLLISVAIVARYRAPNRESGRWFARIAAAIVFIAGLFVATRKITGWPSPLEEQLYWALLKSAFMQSRVMAAPTGLVFALIALTVLIQSLPWGRSAWGRRGALLLASLVFLLSVFQIAIQTVFRSALPFVVEHGAPMALVGAIGFACLAIALAAFSIRLSHPDGMPALFQSPTAGDSWMPMGTLGLLALLVGGLTATYLRHEQDQDRESAWQLLESIGALKETQIVNWRRERLGDARFFSQADFVAKDVEAFLDHPDSPRARAELFRWLNLLKAGDRYSVVALLGTNGAVRLAAGSGDTVEVPRQTLDAAGQSTEPVITDIHRNKFGEIRMELLVPVRRNRDDTARKPGLAGHGPILGYVLLELDPEQFLYPLLQSWPTPSRTAETGLFRREGDEVVFISQMRFWTNPPLTARFAITTNSEIPAVRGLLGSLGRVEGRDYRQRPVLANVQRLLESDWFMLTKVDRNEIYEQLQSHAWMTLALTAVLVTALGFATGFIVKRGEVREAEEQLLAERRRLELAQRVESLMRHANDAIILADGENRILEANEKAQQLYGQTLGQLQQMRTSDLQQPGTINAFAASEKLLRSTGHAIFTTTHGRRDGTAFPVEVSASMVKIGGDTVNLSIIRDISQQLAHEREIQRLTRLYATLSQINQTIVRVESAEKLFEAACRITVDFGGFKGAWIGRPNPGTGIVELVAMAGNLAKSPDPVRMDDTPTGRGPMGTCLREDRPCIFNDFLNDARAEPWRAVAQIRGLRSAAAIPIHFRGEVHGGLVVFSDEVGVFKDKEVELLKEITFDISYALERLENESQRQRAEQALRQSEENLRLFITQAPVALAMFDQRMAYLAASHRWISDYNLENTSLIGRSHYEVFPDIPDRWREIHRRGLAGEVIEADEDHFERANGTTQWLRWAVRPWRGQDGQIGGIVIFSEDVSDRKRSQRALRESEARFRSVVKLSPVSMYIAQRDGTLSYVNDHFTALFGYTVADIPTVEEWRNKAYPDAEYRNMVSVQWATVAEKASAGIQTSPAELTVTCKDGSVRVVEASGAVSGDTIFVLFFDLTERKRAEEALLQRLKIQNQLARVAGTVPGMIFSFRLRPDGSCCIPYASDAIERVFGVSPEEVREDARAVFDLLHPEDIARVRESIALSARALTPWRTEFRVCHASKGELWMEGNSVPQSEPDGSVLWYGFIHDVTERKRTEAALRESDMRLRYLSNNLSNCMLYQLQSYPDGRRRFNYVSDAVRALHGISPEEVQLDSARFYHDVLKEDRERVAREERAAQEKGTVFNTEMRFRGPTGEIRWAQLISTPRKLPDGSTLWDGIEIDVTDRKKAQEELRKLSSAVEQSPSSIVITDTQGRIEYVNPKFCELTGYTFDEVRGANPRVLKSGATPAENYRTLWETISGGGVWHGEFQNRKKNGELFWESAAISPVVDEAGHITHFLAIKEDITEQKKLEEQLRQSQKMEAIGQLAGGVAHDFNNILAATMLHLELLQQRTDLDEELQSALKDLISHSRRAAGLTRQLLLFSRRSVMQVQALDLNEVVENMLKMLRRIIGETVKLEWQGQSNLPQISGDAGMLDQVVMNLAVNARDAMPDGGRVTIATDSVIVDSREAAAISDARPGEFVRLSVTDTGCGMDEALMKRIFEPFFTTKAAGKGTGLGLATVYGIARQHQGWVTVESELGQGSTFRIYFPVRPGAKPAVGAGTEKQALPRGTETILLVEDDPNVRRVSGTVLRHLGYNVHEACSGLEALQKWELLESNVALLFTDMVMPDGITGLQLAEKLRSRKPQLRIIITSGYSADLLQETDLAGKGIVFLPKPCRSPILAAAVRRALDTPVV
jgi:PAS domain S-box-containing protein